MKQNNLSVKKLCMLVVAGMIFSMLAITVILGVVMKDVRIFIAGGVLTLCALIWLWVLDRRRRNCCIQKGVQHAGIWRGGHGGVTGVLPGAFRTGGANVCIG